LKQKLLRAMEKAQADLGYRGEPGTIILPNEFDSRAVKKLKKDVRVRHETVNKRFKQFAILKELYRHSIDSHQAVFEAVAVLTQIALTNGEELYQVRPLAVEELETPKSHPLENVCCSLFIVYFTCANSNYCSSRLLHEIEVSMVCDVGAVLAQWNFTAPTMRTPVSRCHALQY
jgi:hypothetical protein